MSEIEVPALDLCEDSLDPRIARLAPTALILCQQFGVGRLCGGIICLDGFDGFIADGCAPCRFVQGCI
jgi:hypothetical protein